MGAGPSGWARLRGSQALYFTKKTCWMGHRGAGPIVWKRWNLFVGPSFDSTHSLAIGLGKGEGRSKGGNDENIETIQCILQIRPELGKFI